MTRIGIAIFVLATATGSSALAQGYPAKNIRLINAYAPGGASDVVARAFAVKLTEYMGQQVTVENRVGAGGNIASEYVARSAPDGYTILMSTIFLATNAHLYSKLTWDAQRDFAPVSMVTASPLILCVHPSLPVK